MTMGQAMTGLLVAVWLVGVVVCVYNLALLWLARRRAKRFLTTRPAWPPAGARVAGNQPAHASRLKANQQQGHEYGPH